MRKVIIILLAGIILCGCKKKEKERIFVYGKAIGYSALSGKKVVEHPARWDEAIVLEKCSGLWKVKFICGGKQWIDPNDYEIKIPTIDEYGFADYSVYDGKLYVKIHSGSIELGTIKPRESKIVQITNDKGEPKWKNVHR
jgi:hypothetical protein